MKLLTVLTVIPEAPLSTLRAEPLVAAGMFQIECLELRPFVNWSLLFAQRPCAPGDSRAGEG